MVTIDKGNGHSASGETLLAALEDARVFNVSKTDDGRFEFEESCDNYFGAFLTKEQVLALAEELRALASGA